MIGPWRPRPSHLLVIEHLRGQAAYRQQQAKRLTELSRSDAGRAQALEESLVLVLTRRSPSPTAPNAAAEASDDPGLIPLDPTTVRQVLVTLGGLPRPVLEGYRFAEDFVFTRAFRKRFQVPDEAPSIADRICQRRHQDWIEAFWCSTSRWRSEERRFTEQPWRVVHVAAPGGLRRSVQRPAQPHPGTAAGCAEHR